MLCGSKRIDTTLTYNYFLSRQKDQTDSYSLAELVVVEVAGPQWHNLPAFGIVGVPDLGCIDYCTQRIALLALQVVQPAEEPVVQIHTQQDCILVDAQQRGVVVKARQAPEVREQRWAAKMRQLEWVLERFRPLQRPLKPPQKPVVACMAAG